MKGGWRDAKEKWICIGLICFMGSIVIAAIGAITLALIRIAL